MTEDEVIEILFKKKYPTSRQAAIDEVEIWKLCGLFKPEEKPAADEQSEPS